MRKQLGVNELPEVVLVQPNPATRLCGDLVAPPLLLLRPNRGGFALAGCDEVLVRVDLRVRTLMPGVFVSHRYKVGRYHGSHIRPRAKDVAVDANSAPHPDLGDLRLPPWPRVVLQRLPCEVAA